MRRKYIKIFSVTVIILGVSWWAMGCGQKKDQDEMVKEISHEVGSIQTFISTTGSVLPKNRLEIKPPVSGRIDRVLVREGETVKAGQPLAWMSSTERAALLDAARGKGEDVLKYWEETYKAIPLLAPIDGDVIVATTQPGQTVTSADAVVVLSDRLIVRAQVDETDIGKIKLEQKAILSLDAYPDTKSQARVDHIYYESKTVNNVTIYEVDLTPQEIPPFFRSGMNATVDFIEQSKDNVLLIPVDAVTRDNGQDFVLLKKGDEVKPVKVRVTLGISDDKNVEVLSGLRETDQVMIKTRKFTLPKKSTGTNPFMPSRRR